VSQNMLSGILSIVFGVFYLIMVIILPEPAMGDPIGPKLFPYVIAIIAIFCGALMLLRELRLSNSSQKEKISINLQENKGLYFKIAVTIILGVIYGLILEPLGYLIATSIFMLGIMFLVNQLSRKLETVLMSIGFSVTTYVVFYLILQLSLPRGLLSF